ncbi:MAG: DUF4405 domain-containing protein [Proteobacteria bacterium]|nr:DUF4405 domain-containing protein [Pseudomonadota bacterium]
MGTKVRINGTINIINLLISIVVFGTGLILFIQFHIGDGAEREAWLGLGKSFWLLNHQIFAIGFLIGFAAHIQTHWKYIKILAKKWRMNLPPQLKSTTRNQLLLLFLALVVIYAGFYPWITMPGATLKVHTFHSWIDVHTRAGLFFLLGMAVHITRRWRRF